MDNNAEIVKLVNELYDNIREAITPIVEAIKKLADSLSTAFLEAWKEVKYDINYFDINYFDINISRKRFTKLLISIGYQRNDANKIAWKYHEEKGKYTLLDFLIENRKKEDLKNDMVRN